MTQAPLYELLPWDTSFFGKLIGRIVPSVINEREFQKIAAWATANDMDCLYFLGNAAHDDSIRLLAAHGFHFVDIRVTKGIALSQEQVQSRQLDQSSIRPATAADIETLRTIAGTSHTDSRFYFDRNFDSRRASELYKLWIEKSCTGWADAVFVAIHEGQPAGYISCHQDSPTLGRIGLVGVAGNAQGKGLGMSLAGAALEWFKRRGLAEVTVVTQGRNIGAQRLYERCGFLTKSVELWYHGWKPFVQRCELPHSV